MQEILHEILSKVNSLDVKVDSLENKVDSLENRMDGFEKRLDNFETRMDNLEGKIVQGFAEVHKKLETILAHIQRTNVHNHIKRENKIAEIETDLKILKMYVIRCTKTG